MEMFGAGASRRRFKCWIDQLEIMFPELKKPALPPHNRLRNIKNKTGISGVILEVRPPSHSNKKVRSQWTSSYQYNKKRIKHNFSIDKFGNKQAFKMACVMHYIIAGKLRVYSLKNLPCKPPVPYEIIK